MKILLFGATGMVGQGVLLECLADDAVRSVLAVGRAPLGRTHEKLRELVLADVSDVAPVAEQLAGYDACLFCLGVSSVGMSDADYRRITHDLTLSVARTLAEVNPGTVFVYVSGQGTDRTGRAAWARVKAATEDALFALPLNAYAVRPGIIRPPRGVRSRTRLYAALYLIARPLFPVLRAVAPGSVTTGEQLGRAMLRLATGTSGAPKVLENKDINALAPV